MPAIVVGASVMEWIASVILTSQASSLAASVVDRLGSVSMVVVITWLGV